MSEPKGIKKKKIATEERLITTSREEPASHGKGRSTQVEFQDEDELITMNLNKADDSFSHSEVDYNDNQEISFRNSQASQSSDRSSADSNSDDDDDVIDEGEIQGVSSDEENDHYEERHDQFHDKQE